MCQLIVSLNDAIHRDLTQSRRLLYVRLAGGGGGEAMFFVCWQAAGQARWQAGPASPTSSLIAGKSRNKRSRSRIKNSRNRSSRNRNSKNIRRKNSQTNALSV